MFLSLFSGGQLVEGPLQNGPAHGEEPGVHRALQYRAPDTEVPQLKGRGDHVNGVVQRLGERLAALLVPFAVRQPIPQGHGVVVAGGGVLLQVVRRVDQIHPPAQVVEHLIHELGADQLPRIDVFNKSDLVGVGEIMPHGENIVSISAKTGEGIDRLLAAIGERLDTGAKRVTIHLPYDKGGLVERLYQEAKVEQVDYGETIDVVAVCTPKTIGQLGPLVEGWQPHKEPWED